jgi:hypothetical protein
MRLVGALNREDAMPLLAVMTAISKSHTLTANVATKIADANALRAAIFVGTQGAVFIGGADVSFANGYPLNSGERIPITTTGAQAELWAIGIAAYTVSTLEFEPL